MPKPKKAIRDKVPDTFGEKLDLIVELLHTRLNKNNKRLLFDTFKELQETTSLSVEYIRYLILNSKNQSIKRKTYSKEIAHETNAIIKKFVKILKRSGVKIELSPMTYKCWKRDIDIIKVEKQGVLRKFRI